MKKLFSALLAGFFAAGSLTACNSASSGGPPGPQGAAGIGVERAAVPVPIAALPNTHPLTGLQTGAGFREDQRPVAVMVDNIRHALPQRGISQADLTFEMVTEGGITRLMCVYGDYAAMPQVGPVRSARDQHVQMMLPMAALYLHVGGSTHATAMLADYGWSNKDIDGKTYAATALRFDQERSNAGSRSEQCWFSSGELVQNTLENSELEATMQPGAVRGPVFHFAPYNESPRTLEGGDAPGVYVRFSGYTNAGFAYNAESGLYEKSAYGQPQVDANDGSTAAYANVFVLFTEIGKYPDGVLAQVDLAQNGTGYYFSGGRYEKIRWLKGAPEAPLRMLTGDGTETDITVNPGASYIAFVDLDEYAYFRIDGSPETADAMEDDGSPGPDEGIEAPDEADDLPVIPEIPMPQPPEHVPVDEAPSQGGGEGPPPADVLPASEAP